jgi:hypothetical protein
MLYFSNDPPENHAATVVDFINTYRKTPVTERNLLFETVSHYVLSCGWKKMWKIIDHWSSRGFLQILAATTPRMVQDSYDKFGKDVKRFTNRRDSSFGRILGSMREEEIREVMGELPGADPRHTVQLTKLRAAFHQVLSPVAQPEGKTTYNADTCVEFHQLLVAVLSGYHRALSGFREAWTNVNRNSQGSPPNGMNKGKELNVENPMDLHKRTILIPYALALWRFTHLLWRIAYSRSLRYHLFVLDAGGCLSLPRDKPDRNKFEDKDADAELIRLLGDSQDLFMKLLRWIRLHANPFVALDIVSAFSAHHGAGDTDISFLAMRSPLASHAPLEPWEVTISKLGKRPNATSIVRSSAGAEIFDTQAAIKVLKQKMIGDNLNESQLNIIKALSSDFRFPGNVHGEAMLASIMKYVEQEMNPGEVPMHLRHVIEVLWCHLVLYC